MNLVYEGIIMLEMKIKIDDCGGNEIIERFAGSLRSNCEKFGDENSYVIPKNLGSGIISGTNFSNGTSLFRYNFSFLFDTCFEFSSKEKNPLLFLYLIDGKIDYQPFEESTKKTRSGYSLLLGGKRIGNKIYFPKKKNIKLLIVNINRKKFIEQFTLNLKDGNRTQH